MKYVIAAFLCLTMIACGIFYLVRNDVPSHILSIYVTRHQIDRRNTDYFFNPVSKQVYYSPSGDWTANGLQKIPDARKLAFNLLSAEYGITAQSLYYKAVPLPQFDIQTVVPLASFDTFSPYVKDKNGVYMMTDADKPTFVKLEGADPESFDIEAAEENSGKTVFAKDAARCYYNGRVLVGAMPDKFGVLGPAKFEDGTYIYSLDLDAAVLSGNGPINIASLHKEILPPEEKPSEGGDDTSGEAGAADTMPADQK